MAVALHEEAPLLHVHGHGISPWNISYWLMSWPGKFPEVALHGHGEMAKFQEELFMALELRT
jgi:hypothetical protein